MQSPTHQNTERHGAQTQTCYLTTPPPSSSSSPPLPPSTSPTCPVSACNPVSGAPVSGKALHVGPQEAVTLGGGSGYLPTLVPEFEMDSEDSYPYLMAVLAPAILEDNTRTKTTGDLNHPATFRLAAQYGRFTCMTFSPQPPAPSPPSLHTLGGGRACTGGGDLRPP
jgi:hypothetical protein